MRISFCSIAATPYRCLAWAGHSAHHCWNVELLDRATSGHIRDAICVARQPERQDQQKTVSIFGNCFDCWLMRPESLKNRFFVPILPFFFSNKNSVSQVLCYLFNPMVVLYIALVILTRWSLGDLSFYPLLKRSLSGAMDALTFSIVDSAVSVVQPSWAVAIRTRFFIFPLVPIDHRNPIIFSHFQIYGNWLYPLVTLIFYPIWTEFFGALCIRNHALDVPLPEKKSKLKLNWSAARNRILLAKIQNVDCKCHFLIKRTKCWIKIADRSTSPARKSVCVSISKCVFHQHFHS